jgi:hypothetical protein
MRVCVCVCARWCVHVCVCICVCATRNAPGCVMSHGSTSSLSLNPCGPTPRPEPLWSRRYCFYITESEPYKQQVFFYRKPVWSRLQVGPWLGIRRVEPFSSIPNTFSSYSHPAWIVRATRMCLFLPFHPLAHFFTHPPSRLISSHPPTHPPSHSCPLTLSPTLSSAHSGRGPA